MSAYLSLDLLIIEASHLLVAKNVHLILCSKLLSISAPLLVTLVVSMLTSFVLYWIEQKRSATLSQQTTLVKESLKNSPNISFTFFGGIPTSNSLQSGRFFDIEFGLGIAPKNTLFQMEYIQIVIAVLLIVLAVLVKVRSQKNICRDK